MSWEILEIFLSYDLKNLINVFRISLNLIYFLNGNSVFALHNLYEYKCRGLLKQRKTFRNKK